MSSYFTRGATCLLVAFSIWVLGCDRASDKELAETRQLIRQTAADTEALRKDLREALEKNNQVTEQLHGATAEAERQRKARLDADEQQAAKAKRQREDLLEAGKQIAEYAKAAREQKTETVYRPIIEEKSPPNIKREESPPKKSADIIIHSIEVYSTRTNGEPWDESGPPDLKVELTNLDTNQTYVTNVARDTQSAAFRHKSIRVTEGQKFRVTVWDDDVVFSDKIGSFEKDVTADTIATSKVNWTFDRVTSLVLEFQP